MRRGSGLRLSRTVCDPSFRSASAILPCVCPSAGVPCPEPNPAVGGLGGTLPRGAPPADFKREDRRGDACRDLPHLAARDEPPLGSGAAGRRRGSSSGARRRGELSHDASATAEKLLAAILQEIDRSLNIGVLYLYTFRHMERKKSEESCTRQAPS